MLARILGTGACLSAMLLAGAAVAQESVSADPGQIVVQGSKDIKREVRAFVGALAENPAIKQLSRFKEEVCPAVVGLAPTQRDAVVSRMRQVAEAVGVDAAPMDCAPNVLVVVTTDKRRFVELLRRERPDQFNEISAMEIRRLIATPGPAVAWHRPGTLITARGTPVFFDSGQASDTAGLGGWAVNRTTEPDTRRQNAIRPQFGGAVVVIEAAAVAGLTTTQVADYAAMRAYASTHPERIAASISTTILKVLEAPMGSSVPASLTNWDLGYLRGLYASNAYLYAGAQRSAIRREILRQLEQPKAE